MQITVGGTPLSRDEFAARWKAPADRFSTTLRSLADEVEAFPSQAGDGESVEQFVDSFFSELGKERSVLVGAVSKG